MLTKKQIKAIEDLTGYKLRKGSKLSIFRKFITFEKEYDGLISYMTFNYEIGKLETIYFQDGIELPVKWLGPLAKILEEK